MKKLITTIGIAASVLLVAGCESGENEPIKENGELAGKTVTVQEKENKAAEKVTTVEEDVETGEKENIPSKEENNKDSNEKNVSHSEHDDHNHEHYDPLELQSEDIIVQYFNAISNEDVSTLKKLFPSGSEENQQLEEMFKTSSIRTDINKMEKISVAKEKSEYKIQVKYFTEKKDENFTDNVSSLHILLNPEKGIIEQKVITQTKYLE